MKTKFILSLLSCILSLVVFVFISFAWITLGDVNTAGNITGAIYGKNCEYELSVYDNNSWVASPGELDVSDLGISRVEFFKFTVTNTSDSEISITIVLRDYTTVVSEELVYDEVNKFIYVTDRENNQIPIYNTNEEGYVMIGDTILYDCTDGTVKMGDLKMESSMELYLLGTVGEGVTPTLEGATQINFTDNLAQGINLPIGESVDVFFAIRFSETENDTYYQFQKFRIEGLNITIG